MARQERLNWLVIADARLVKLQATTTSLLDIWGGYRPFNIWISAWPSRTAYLLDAYGNLCLSIGCTLEMCLEWHYCTTERSSSSSQRGKVKLTTHRRCKLKATQTSSHYCLHIGYVRWLLGLVAIGHLIFEFQLWHHLCSLLLGCLCQPMLVQCSI